MVVDDRRDSLSANIIHGAQALTSTIIVMKQSRKEGCYNLVRTTFTYLISRTGGLNLATLILNSADRAPTSIERRKFAHSDALCASGAYTWLSAITGVPRGYLIFKGKKNWV